MLFTSFFQDPTVSSQEIRHSAFRDAKIRRPLLQLSTGHSAASQALGAGQGLVVPHPAPGRDRCDTPEAALRRAARSLTSARI